LISQTPAATIGNATTTMITGDSATYQAGARLSRERQLASSDLTNKAADMPPQLDE
jgi:hypothetical protein